MDASRDIRIREAEDIEAENTWSKADSSQRCQQLSKLGGVKSLALLSGRDSLKNIEKLRRRNGSYRRIFLNRGFNNAFEKRSKRKYCKKRFDKSCAFDATFRKAKDRSLTVADDNGFGERAKNKRENLVCLVREEDENDNEKEVVKKEKGEEKEKEKENENEKEKEKEKELSFLNVKELQKEARNLSDATHEISRSLERLRLASIENSHNSENAHELEVVIAESVPKGFSNETLGDAACGQSCDPKRRRCVQWNGQVDVIYYAGNDAGSRVVKRGNEPLREEEEQQARRHIYIDLALTKNVLANITPSQFHEPWLIAVSK